MCVDFFFLESVPSMCKNSRNVLVIIIAYRSLLAVSETQKQTRQTDGHRDKRFFVPLSTDPRLTMLMVLYHIDVAFVGWFRRVRLLSQRQGRLGSIAPAAGCVLSC